MKKALHLVLVGIAFGALGCGGDSGLNGVGGFGTIPVLSKTTPQSLPVGSPATTIDVYGANFLVGVQVLWAGTPLQTTGIDPGHLKVQVPAKDLAAPAVVTLSALNPNNSTSNNITFTVGDNPIAKITGLSPSAATAGSGSFLLNVSGSNFVTGSLINFGGLNIATKFVSTGELTAQIPGGKIATAGMQPVTVVNPTPGGGPSTAMNFLVN